VVIDLTIARGLAYYNGKLFPKWRGNLLAGGLRGLGVYRLELKHGKVVAEEPLLTDLKARIRDVRVGPDGAVYVGSPETVAAKIARTITALGLTRFDMKYSNGTLPHDTMMKSIELYGTKVVPLVREQLD